MSLSLLVGTTVVPKDGMWSKIVASSTNMLVFPNQGSVFPSFSSTKTGTSCNQDSKNERVNISFNLSNSYDQTWFYMH